MVTGNGMSAPLPVSYSIFRRKSSLPTETEEERRKRKEPQNGNTENFGWMKGMFTKLVREHKWYIYGVVNRSEETNPNT